MEDILQLDIMLFIPTAGWSEAEKAAFAVKFGQSLLVFLLSSFDDQLPPESDASFATLVAKQPSAAEVTAFYQQLFPNLETDAQQKAREFKKLFIIKLYEDKVALLTQAADQQTDQTKQAELKAASEKWLHCVGLARHDQWQQLAQGFTT